MAEATLQELLAMLFPGHVPEAILEELQSCSGSATPWILEGTSGHKVLPVAT